jgi:hypothetical protein
VLSARPKGRLRRADDDLARGVIFRLVALDQRYDNIGSSHQLFAMTAATKAARIPALNTHAIGLAKFSVTGSPVLLETKIRGFSWL